MNPTKQFRGRGTDFGYACSPVIVEGKLIVPVGGEGASVVALDVKDGAVVWKSGDSPASYASPLPITLKGRRQVIVPLENSLNGLPFLKIIRSKSVLGLSSVVMIFDTGTELLRARQLVQERLNLAQGRLPAIVKPPVALDTKIPFATFAALFTTPVMVLLLMVAVPVPITPTNSIAVIVVPIYERIFCIVLPVTVKAVTPFRYIPLV